MSDLAPPSPAWLTQDFLQSVIREAEKHGEAPLIVRYEVTPAAGPGDNYISDIYRVFVETSDTKKRYFIVKSLPTAEFNLQFIRDARLFEKEIQIYDSILPSMRTVKNCKTNLTMAPLCFFTRPNSLVVLEDLLQLGYQVVDRRVGLDLEHCVEALKCLARFHVLSTAISRENLATHFSDTVYSGESRGHARNYVANCVLSVASRVDTWAGYERFAQKLRDIAPSSCDRVIALFASESVCPVLNHGDFWTNNIMFRHSEDGRVSAVKMIDFQMCRYVSPAFDLLYFLYTSPQEGIRANHKDVLMKEYFEEFCLVSNNAGLQANLSFEGLKAEIEKNAFFGFINAIMMLPAVLSTPEDTPDLQNVAKGESGMKWVSGEMFRRQFQQILMEFENTGCI